MNITALLSNLKTNPIPALAGLFMAASTMPAVLNDPNLAKYAPFLGLIGGFLLMFSKQSTTTGGITPNATAVADTLPPALVTPAVTIVVPPVAK